MPRGNTSVKVYVDINMGDDYEHNVEIVCDGSANFERELYGSDIDGNRGVWTTFADDARPDIADLEFEITERFPNMLDYEILDCEVYDEW